MRNHLLSTTLLIVSFASSGPVTADDHLEKPSSDIEFDIQLNFEQSQQTGVTLGDNPLADQLNLEEVAFEFDLNYEITESFYVFFGGSFFDTAETIKPSDTSFESSGFERGTTGIGYRDEAEVDFQIEAGRLEYSDSQQRWWDQSLDTVRLQIDASSFSFMLGAGSEQQPENTDLDFIDPEEKGIHRLLANFNWQILDDHQLAFFYLDHDDQSSSQALNQTLRFDKADESDASLRWAGWQYLGKFQSDQIGELEWMLGYTTLTGKETIYDYSEPVGNQLSVDDIQQFDIEAESQGWRLAWTPQAFDSLQLIMARNYGSGDSNLGDLKNTAFRQTGLQGENEGINYYGELYQAEISNLLIRTIGFKLEVLENLQVALLNHEFRQDHLDTEMRDVSIDLDTTGLSRNLGSETDLLVSFAPNEDLELEFIIAEFNADNAYGASQSKTSRYWKFEASYQF